METALMLFFALLFIGSIWVAEQAVVERLPLRFIMVPMTALYALFFLTLIAEGFGII